MWLQTFIAVRMFVIFTLITGVIYPLFVTIVAQTCFSDQANGSLLRSNGEIVGSDLIGQSFSQPHYFWSRLSATSMFPYNAAASGGTNYGPLHPDLRAAVNGRVFALIASGGANRPIPVDLVTASASGLDPHISPAAAEYQVERVAVARNLSADEVRNLVYRHTEQRQFGLLGEPRVNVLRLNLALDERTKHQ